MNASNLKFNFLNELDVTEEVKRKLSSNLSRIVSGNTDVIITPIGKENNVDSILSEWNKVFQLNTKLINKPLKRLEDLNKDKFGARSVQIPWVPKRREDFMKYFKSSGSKRPPVPIDDKGKLRPLSVNNAAKYLKPSTNSGLPYYTKKSKVKETLLQNFDNVLSRQDPCVLFTRSQEQTKTRNVWGYPIADTVNESRYYFPLLDYQKRKAYRCALSGPDAVNVEMTKLISKASNSNEVALLSLDFSLFDTTVNQSIQDSVFAYIKNLFQSSSANDLDYIRNRFGNIGIVCPDGIITKPHGVPSGSTFTNEVDSLTQYLILKTIDVVQDFVIQGDDSVCIINKGSKDKVINELESYGLKVNDEKSYYEDNFAVYLQNLFHPDYKFNGLICGIYPTFRAINRILFQERWAKFEDYGIEGRDYYSIRTISILENCKYHPLFEDLVKFILKYDKYSLEYSKRGLTKYIDMISKTEGSAGIINNQYEDNLTGINNFETVKLIRKISS